MQKLPEFDIWSRRIMTQEDEEKRKLLGIKSEDIFYIPTAPLWELCRQFDEALPGKYKLEWPFMDSTVSG
jgi:hypothetical protein